MLRAPGRNADAVAEMAVGAAVRGDPRHRARRPRRARGRDLPRRHHPLPALPGLAARGPDRRHRRARRGRAGPLQWRFDGLGMRVISYDPFAPDATHSLDDLLAEADVVSMHAAVTPETAGDDRRRAVRADAARARSTSTPPAPRSTTPTRSPRRWPTATSAAPASTTSSASTSPSTTRCARWATSCSRRTSAARPTTPRRTTRRSSPTGSPPCSTAAARQPREPGGPASEPSDAPRRPRRR